MNKLVIIGAGGHGRVVADCAQLNDTYSEIVFLDDCFGERNENSHWEIVGTVDCWPSFLDTAEFIVAFGNNVLRLAMLHKLMAENAKVVSIIHPTAVISPSVSIACGCAIFANAVINIDSKVGIGCIINTNATVDHDCSIKEAVHISPGVNIAGGVSIGSLSWIGIGSTTTQYIDIACNTQTGAGAVVITSTEPDSLYVGIPAKKIRSLINTSK